MCKNLMHLVKLVVCLIFISCESSDGPTGTDDTGNNPTQGELTGEVIIHGMDLDFSNGSTRNYIRVYNLEQGTSFEIDIPGTVDFVAGSSTKIWAADEDGRIYQLDRATQIVEDSIPFKGEIKALQHSGGEAWVLGIPENESAAGSNKPHAYRIAGTGNAFADSCNIGEVSYTYDHNFVVKNGLITVLAGNAFSVLQMTTTCENSLRQVLGGDTDDLYGIPVAKYGYGHMAVGEQKIWVVDSYHDRLIRINREGLTIDWVKPAKDFVGSDIKEIQALYPWSDGFLVDTRDSLGLAYHNSEGGFQNRILKNASDLRNVKIKQGFALLQPGGVSVNPAIYGLVSDESHWSPSGFIPSLVFNWVTE